jgi:hypothetical protein
MLLLQFPVNGGNLSSDGTTAEVTNYAANAMLVSRISFITAASIVTDYNAQTTDPAPRPIFRLALGVCLAGLLGLSSGSSL